MPAAAAIKASVTIFGISVCKMKLLLLLLALEVAPLMAIYNGLKARPHQFPHIVLLNSPRFYCSGCLISESFVVTAAHCLMSVKKGRGIKVTVGAHEYYGNSESDGVMVESRVFWMHENFSMPTAVNDIGLVQLPEKIVVSVKVKPIGVDLRLDVDDRFFERDVVLAGE
jgi:secreted trypsin-like serine protease